MTYYIVKSPASGCWMHAPFRGYSTSRHKAWPYPADNPWLANMVGLALKRGYKMRLRQVMVAEEDA